MPPETSETADTAPAGDNSRTSSDTPQGLAIAAVLLLVCGALVGYGFLNTEEKEEKPRRATPTAEVTYEVTGKGTADISYLARSEAGTATVEKSVPLPWKKSVRVPVGQAPIIAITLDEKGGQATCTLAIQGTHVQLATATGTFGRATCTGELPSTDLQAGPAG